MPIALIAAALTIAQPHPTRIRDAAPAQPNMAARNSETEGQRVLHDYAMCLTRRERRGVETYLAAPVASAEAERLADRIATTDCLESGTLSFQPLLFRGALFDVLYKLDHAQRASVDFAAVPRVTYVSGDPATLSAAQRDWRALTGFGDCVVRAAPAETRQLILSNVTSDQERASFRQIRPHLGPCLPQGVELEFSRPMLRGVIAESLYRLTVATAATPAASVATR